MKIIDNLKKLAKDIKGFTLVELLVTVIILGLLSGIAIVSVTSTQKKSYMEYDEKQNELFTTAAQSYYQDNRVMLTNLKLLNTNEVNLQTLIDQNYIDKVVDYKKKEYDYQKSKAYVKKTGTGKYIYYSELYDKNGKLRATNKPNSKDKKNGESIITIGNPLKENNEEYNHFNESKSSYESSKMVYYVNDTAKIGITIKDSNGISSYQYRITKLTNINSSNNEKQYKTSGEILIDNTSYSDTITLDTKDYANGIYKLHIDAYSYSSIVSTRETNYFIVVDKTKPKCTITLEGEKGSKDRNKQWYKNSDKNSSGIKVKMNITEANKYKNRLEKTNYEKNKSLLGSYISLDSKVTKIQDKDTTSEGQTWYGVVEDKAGNLGYCNTIVYLDRELPKCTTTKEYPLGAEEYKGWTNKDYEAIRKCEDNYSGCTENTKSETVYVKGESGKEISTSIGFKNKEVKDKAGNSTTCEDTKVNIDKKGPICTVSGGNEKWTTDPITITAKCTDNGSGCPVKNFDRIYDEDISTNTAGAKDNNQGGNFYDNLGNITECEAKQTVKIDKFTPTIEIINDYDNIWTNKNYSITIKVQTGISGAYLYENDKQKDALYKSGQYEYTKQITFNENNINKKYTYYAKSPAGKKSIEVSTTIKIDKTPPVMTIAKKSGDKTVYAYCVDNEKGSGLKKLYDGESLCDRGERTCIMLTKASNKDKNCSCKPENYYDKEKKVYASACITYNDCDTANNTVFKCQDNAGNVTLGGRQSECCGCGNDGPGKCVFSKVFVNCGNTDKDICRDKIKNAAKDDDPNCKIN